MAGGITVIAGPMFSGKTEHLISRLVQANARGLRAHAYKPRVDNRYAVGALVSHGGQRFPARIYEDGVSSEADMIGVDEAQFLPESLTVHALEWAKEGRQVVVSGLDLNCFGEPFGAMSRLLALATEVVKLTSKCARCGGVGTRSQRILPLDFAHGQMFIGGSEAYEARCFSCFSPVEMTNL